MQWKCLSCGKQADPRKWLVASLADVSEHHPSVVEMYADMGLDLAEVRSDPRRRRLDGVILEAAGISGIATGGCGIIFDRDVVTLAIGDLSNRTSIRYEDITVLQFAGRGAVTEQSGGGWVGGGFGLSGALEGVLTASALNSLTATTSTRIESVVSFAWLSNWLILLNQHFVPERLAEIFAPVVDRIREAHFDAPAPVEASGNLTSQLTELANLHKSGALTDEEFMLAKAKILGP
jgi:hypothetical protein